MNIRRLARTHAAAFGGAVLFAACALSPLSAAANITPASAAPATAPEAAKTDAQQAGVMKSVQGDVKALRADGRAQALKPGDAIHQIDRIQTGPNSGASLRLRDGTVLVLGPQSQLDLKQYQFNATTHDGNILLSLLQGSLRMVSGLIAKKQPEAVRVDTKTATIGIRGTDFIVTTDAQP